GRVGLGYRLLLVRRSGSAGGRRRAVGDRRRRPADAADARGARDADPRADRGDLVAVPADRAAGAGGVPGRPATTRVHATMTPVLKLTPTSVYDVTRWRHLHRPTASTRSQHMDFELSDRAKEYQERLLAFMDEKIYPAEAVYAEQMAESGDPNFHPPILEELKAEARKRGLWNLFHPHKNEEWGSPGLSNLDYAPLAEITGRSPHLAPEAINCNAPDTGNMEVLELFGTEEHKEKYLKPPLAGEMASAFCITQPAV